MIERITIENFKSLKQVDLKLGRLNLFIGTNASGKSNLFDALRLLRGIAGGSPVTELFEGGVRTSAGEVWHGIRGGLANAIYQAPIGPHSPSTSQARMRVQMTLDLGAMDYRFAFNDTGTTIGEHLSKAGEELFFYDGNEAYFKLSERERMACYPNPSLGSQVILAFRTGLAGAHKEVVEAWTKHLVDMQFLRLDPDILRGYGAAVNVRRMGEGGENFASLVRHICADVKRKEAYLSWLRELRPQEVDDVTTLSGAVGEPLFALQESGREFPAPVLSDGTLRFAALTAAFFQPDMPKVLTIEEIENGVHGSRLRLVVELLRSQTASANTQVLATTHSPLVLAWLKPEEYSTTFFCRRDEATGESRICPLTEIPHFNEVIRKQPISDLFGEGWMEAAI